MGRKKKRKQQTFNKIIFPVKYNYYFPGFLTEDVSRYLWLDEKACRLSLMSDLCRNLHCKITQNVLYQQIFVFCTAVKGILAYFSALGSFKSWYNKYCI